MKVTYFLVLVSIIFNFYTFTLLRRRLLRNKSAVLWATISFSLFLISGLLETKYLQKVTSAIGISAPISLFTLVAIITLFMITLGISIHLSELNEQLKKVTQQIGILELEQKQ